MSQQQPKKPPSHDDVLGVVSHLDHMVKLLLVELQNCNKVTLPGLHPPPAPCLEFLLSENLLDKLYEWSSSTGRYANAVRLEQLKLYELLVSHSRHQLLVHEPFLRVLKTLSALQKHSEKLAFLPHMRNILTTQSLPFFAIDFDRRMYAEEDSDYRSRSRLEKPERSKKHRSRRRRNERSKRSESTERSSRHRYGARYRKRSHSNSRTRDRFRHKSRSHSSDRYGSGERHDTSCSYDSDDRHRSHKGKIRYQGSQRGSRLREPDSNLEPFTHLMGSNTSYPLESFLSRYYLENTYPSNMRPQCRLQPDSNLVVNVPCPNLITNSERSYPVEGISSSNMQHYVPFVPENADEYNRLSDRNVFNFLDHILESGYYTQTVPLDLTKTPSVNTSVFHEAENWEVESQPQPDSNLVANVPFLNPSANSVRSYPVEGISSSNMQHNVPYDTENADVYRLPDGNTFNFLDDILQSGHYTQLVPLDTTKTPSVNTPVFHEAQNWDVQSEPAEYNINGRGLADYTESTINGTIAIDLGELNNRILREEPSSIEILPKQNRTSAWNEQKPLTSSKNISKARKETELQKLQKQAQFMFGDCIADQLGGRSMRPRNTTCYKEIGAQERSAIYEPEKKKRKLAISTSISSGEAFKEINDQKLVRHNPKAKQRKLPHNRIDFEQMSEHKKSKESSNPTSAIKNNNAEWHCLSEEKDCKICKYRVVNLVKHYVNEHPSHEVYSSRISPDVAKILRKKEVHKCERVAVSSREYQFRQLCYFCNLTKCFRKPQWIGHIQRHTGYYEYKGVNCSKKFPCKRDHVCEDNCNVVKISQPQFKDVNIVAFLCQLCNFVRLNKIDIESHLEREHDGDVTNRYNEVILLTFPSSEKLNVVEMRKENRKELFSESPNVIETSTTTSSSLNEDIANESDEGWETCSSDSDNVDTISQGR